MVSCIAGVRGCERDTVSELSPKPVRSNVKEKALSVISCLVHVKLMLRTDKTVAIAAATVELTVASSSVVPPASYS